jgi:polar amino acid transport system permease protein
VWQGKTCHTFWGNKMSFLEVTLFLLDGFKISLLIFAVTLICGVPLGLPIAFCSMSRFKAVKNISKVIVWIVRGIPLMLQIFIIYYVPGLLFGYPVFSQIDKFMYLNYGIADSGRIVAVLIAFTVNYACYFSEIYRGGIESISKGQYEAGYVLGLTKSQVFKKIVLKQVVKRIVPPMSNEIITLIKDTALANCIMVCEIIKQAKELAATKALVWPLFYTGAFYLIFVGVLTIVLGKLEKKLSYFRG